MNTITVSYDLINKIGIEEAVVYQCITDRGTVVPFSVRDGEELGLSSFEQRQIFDRLVARGKITIKNKGFPQMRVITVVEGDEDE